MRLTKILTISVATAVLAAPVTPAVAHTKFPRVVPKQASVKKVKKKSLCRSSSCHRRVALRAQRRKMRLTVAPYRSWLLRVRSCESGGNYQTNTGNGFYGAYQFMLSTWVSVGGRGLPSNASPLEQDYRAVILRLRSGSSPWPVCG